MPAGDSHQYISGRRGGHHACRRKNLLFGMSERTGPQAIETTASRLFATDAADRIIVCRLSPIVPTCILTRCSPSLTPARPPSTRR
ncbi:arginine deiminase family protein [Methanogenium cariaci]|uniref:arginine deiminase family protein n=1 Tax=Methanogenium cariaci TaxID=2197 RepID=UPI0009FB3312|nr:arginine deiminase family protein [Methanogenium cariaci]